MNYTSDFFIQAQGVIERVFRAEREELVKANGNIATEQKDDKTPVTELDRRVETKLRSALQGFDASIGLEGEEFGIDGSRKTYWLIDPIDGTEAFTRGGSAFRNMVTLIDDGRPYFTMVYKPVADELYVAAEHEGAFLNGKQISMVERSLKELRIDVHAPGSDQKVWAMMQTIAQHINSIRITGDFVNSATGQLDGLLVYRGKGGPWDFAPRALLLQEAGARVTNIGSQQYDFTINSMLAVHPKVYDQLMKIITDQDALA